VGGKITHPLGEGVPGQGKLRKEIEGKKRSVLKDVWKNLDAEGEKKPGGGRRLVVFSRKSAGSTSPIVGGLKRRGIIEGRKEGLTYLAY